MMAAPQVIAADIPEREYWVSGGLGISAQYRLGSGLFSPHHRMTGSLINMGLFAGFESHLLGLRFADAHYPDGYPKVPAPPLQLPGIGKWDDRSWDFGLVYGKRWGAKRLLAVAYGGLGVTNSSWLNGYGFADKEYSRSSDVGLLLGADLLYVRSWYAGTQFGIFVDINRRRPFWGIHLSGVLGNFVERVERDHCWP